MKVLHVSSAELYGGIETVLVSLARHRALCPALDQHFALCFEGRLSEELQALDVPVYMLGNVRLKSPLSIWRARRMLDSVIKRSACDVIICHGPRTMIFFAKTVRGAQKPLLMWMHGIRVLRRWLNHLLGRNLPDLMICNSLYTQKAVASVFPGIESTVIYYPLETANMLPGAGSATRCERRQAHVKTPPSSCSQAGWFPGKDTRCWSTPLRNLSRKYRGNAGSWAGRRPLQNRNISAAWSRRC